MCTTISIDNRFAGPPNVGNGGYVSGLLAKGIDGAVQVTLRSPTPLDEPLCIDHNADDTFVLRNGHLLAEARQSTLELDIPAVPTYEAVRNTHENNGGFTNHPFPHCFVCGPRRAPADGLCIFPAPLAGNNAVATAWTPHSAFGDEANAIRPEFLWAALDCPGGIAATYDRPRPIFLGQFTTELIRPVQAGVRYIVMGWVISRDGRKHVTGTALFTETGDLCGSAKAIWIEPKS